MWILCAYSYQITINNTEKARMGLVIIGNEETPWERIREIVLRIMGKGKREIQEK